MDNRTILIFGALLIAIALAVGNSSPEDSVSSQPAWSPDGDRIAFIAGREGQAELSTVNVESLEVSRITKDSVSDKRPAWTPGGDQIAFASNRDGQAGRDLYTINPSNGQITRLTYRPEVLDTDPSWTPSQGDQVSQTIVFASNRNGDNMEIYAMDIQTNAITRLTFREGTQDANPTISPDGSRIAFQSKIDDNWEIFVMDANGENIKQLTFNPADDIEPAWSPQGNQIGFSTNRAENYEIYRMDVDGSNKTNLTQNKANDTWPSWSPDAGQIAFQSDRVAPGSGQFELFIMNNDGNEQNQITGLE